MDGIASKNRKPMKVTYPLPFPLPQGKFLETKIADNRTGRGVVFVAHSVSEVIRLTQLALRVGRDARYYDKTSASFALRVDLGQRVKLFAFSTVEFVSEADRDMGVQEFRRICRYSKWQQPLDN